METGEAERIVALVQAGLSEALTDIASIDAMAMSLARATLDVIGADRSIVTFADWDTHRARIAACYGYPIVFTKAATGMTVPFAEPPPEVIQYITPEAAEAGYAEGMPGNSGNVAHVVVPIAVDGRVEGWLTASVTSDAPRLAPDAELEARLMGLAAQASTALRNALLVQQIRHQALHDALTGLPNRALIFDRAEQMLVRARREQSTVGALFLDLDNFKKVNDTLGHALGDELLRGVATRLGGALRAGDTLGRLGGDEFVVLVNSVEIDAGADLVAKRLLASLDEPFLLPGRQHTPLSVTASIGIVIAAETSNAGELLCDADVALYEAKAAGKNCSVLFAPAMQTAVRDRTELEADLRTALTAKQFFLVYQPISDRRTGGVEGVKTLLRWQHPTRGVLLADEFIPTLEDIGLIAEVGRWMLAEACAKAAGWHANGRPVDVAVNVSGRQVDSTRLVDDVRDALATSGLEATSLIVEVTESAIMRDTTAAVLHLSALKALGVRLAIEDFGSWYSSLAYLRQSPAGLAKPTATAAAT